MEKKEQKRRKAKEGKFTKENRKVNEKKESKGK